LAQAVAPGLSASEFSCPTLRATSHQPTMSAAAVEMPATTIEASAEVAVPSAAPVTLPTVTYVTTPVPTTYTAMPIKTYAAAPLQMTASPMYTYPTGSTETTIYSAPVVAPRAYQPSAVPTVAYSQAQPLTAEQLGAIFPMGAPTTFQPFTHTYNIVSSPAAAVPSAAAAPAPEIVSPAPEAAAAPAADAPAAAPAVDAAEAAPAVEEAAAEAAEAAPPVEATKKESSKKLSSKKKSKGCC